MTRIGGEPATCTENPDLIDQVLRQNLLLRFCCLGPKHLNIEGGQ